MNRHHLRYMTPLMPLQTTIQRGTNTSKAKLIGNQRLVLWDAKMRLLENHYVEQLSFERTSKTLELKWPPWKATKVHFKFKWRGTFHSHKNPTPGFWVKSKNTWLIGRNYFLVSSTYMALLCLSCYPQQGFEWCNCFSLQ